MHSLWDLFSSKDGHGTKPKIYSNQLNVCILHLSAVSYQHGTFYDISKASKFDQTFSMLSL